MPSVLVSVGVLYRLPKTVQATLIAHVACPVLNVFTALLLPFAALHCAMPTVLSGYACCCRTSAGYPHI